MGLIYAGVKGIVTAIKNKKAQKSAAASQPMQAQPVQRQQSYPPQQQMPSFGGGTGYSGIGRFPLVEGGRTGFTESTRHMRPDLMINRFGSRFRF